MFLRKKLGIIPQDISLFEMAFIPKSDTIKRNGKYINNARLEFLGDAVFTNLVTELLFRLFPNKQEGELSKIRTRIISRDAQERIALSLGLDQFFTQLNSPVIEQNHLYANTLEALFGALFLDKGYRKTRKYFLRHLLGQHIDINAIIEQETDFKSLLSSWCQKMKKQLIFHTLEQNPEDHTMLFVSTVMIEQKPAGKGTGKTKKTAEQVAARNAWKKLI